jgi:hypothetical protein
MRRGLDPETYPMRRRPILIRGRGALWAAGVVRAPAGRTARTAAPPPRSSSLPVARPAAYPRRSPRRSAHTATHPRSTGIVRPSRALRWAAHYSPLQRLGPAGTKRGPVPPCGPAAWDPLSVFASHASILAPPPSTPCAVAHFPAADGQSRFRLAPTDHANPDSPPRTPPVADAGYHA